MKPCTNLRPKIALLVGGELPPAERPAVDAHLETCADCRSLAAALQDDRAVLAGLALEEIPAETLDRTRARVMEALAAERGAGPHLGRSVGRRGLLLLAATLALAAVGAGLWLAGRQPTEHVGPIARAPVPSESRPAGPRVSSPSPSPPEPPQQTEPATAPSGKPEGATGQRQPGPADATRTNEPVGAARRATPPRPERLAAAGELRGPASTVSPEDATPPADPSPITIRIVSDDPDVVYYWLSDEPKEVSDDEAV